MDKFYRQSKELKSLLERVIKRDGRPGAYFDALPKILAHPIDGRIEYAKSILGLE